MSFSWTLSENELERLFPFYIAIDTQLCIQHMGKGLKKVAPSIYEGQHISEVFSWEQPFATLPESLSAFTQNLRALYCARIHSHLCHEGSIRFKGECLEKGDLILLLWLPIINNPTQMAHSQLNIGDFPAHSNLGDFLILTQTQQMAIQDITKLSSSLKDKQKALKVALDEAKNASKLKSEFLANMSHEIRTPINGVIGMLELLSRHELQSKSSRMVDMARYSAKSLLGIINDILDLSKIEAGKLNIENALFPLLEVLENSSVAQTLVAEKKGLQLIMDLEGINNTIYQGDQYRLQQIINNLLSNAIKFTHKGSVTFKARIYDDKETSVLKCCISDTGVGIPADKQASLFEAFTQADASTTRNFGGTGLGLTIVKKLCELMGGSIELFSAESGSQFHFSVTLQRPASKTRPTTIEPTQAQALAGLSSADPHKKIILVVEDNRINQEVITGFLDDINTHFFCVENGQQALKYLAKHHSDVCLILMDCQMPVMDGFMATQHIRAGDCGSIAAKLPIIALTANAMSNDKEKCLAAGMSDYLAKPIDFDVLEKIINKWR